MTSSAMYLFNEFCYVCPYVPIKNSRSATNAKYVNVYF